MMALTGTWRLASNVSNEGDDDVEACRPELKGAAETPTPSRLLAAYITAFFMRLIVSWLRCCSGRIMLATN